MKLVFLKNFIALISFLLIVNLVQAQGTSTVIRGKVVDASTKEALPGASIVLEGKKSGASTNLKGEFEITVPNNNLQKIIVSYIGYDDKSIEVSANSKATVVVELSTAKKSKLANVTVIGTSKEGQAKALNQQRTAENIKNIISADMIGRFPDLNVAEALQRVPGVNIERDRGEGGVVQMRGAPPSFTTVNINGEQIPGTQSDGSRNQELSVIPVDQLSSMEVTKAITPDMDGDNIGGNVDLKTPTAKGKKWKGKIEVGGGYNNIVQKTNFIGRVSLGKRFFATDNVKDGRLGITAGYSMFETQNGRDRAQYSYPATYTPVHNKTTGAIDSTSYIRPIYYRLRDLENLRRRVGASTTIDYKFDNKNSLTFNYMYTQRFDRDAEKRVQYDFNQGALTGALAATTWANETDGSITNNNTSIRRFIHPRIFDVRTNTFTLEGKNAINKVTIDYLAFMSSSNNRNDAGRSSDFRSGALTTQFINPNSDYANIVAKDKSIDVHNPFLINTFRNFQDRADIIKARNLAFKINVTVPYKLGSHDAQLKFGGKIRQINNDRDREFAEYDFINGGYVNEATLFASMVSSSEDQTFFRSRVRFGPTLDAGKLNSFISNTFSNRPTALVKDVPSSITQRSAWFYQAQENVQAAYAMTKVNIGNMMILGGLRYEGTRLNNTTASLFQRSSVTGNDSLHTIDSNIRANYNFILPNIHFKYSLDKNTNIRAAATSSFARPNFTDVMPRENLNINNNTVDLGNPILKAPRSLNLDLLAEHYFSNIGIISGGVFYKRIKDFIFTKSFNVNKTYREADPTAPGGFVDVTEPFTATQPQNGDIAHVFGAEINLQYNIDKGMLKGVGVIANYTFTHSNASTFERKNIRLPGQAIHTANFALSYDYKDFSIKAMLNFNGAVVRSLGPDQVQIGRFATNKLIVNTNGDFDTWRADRYQLDMSASYKLSKRFRIYCEFVNLTNRPESEYLGNIQNKKRNNPVNIEFYDWWNRFGIACSF